MQINLFFIIIGGGILLLLGLIYFLREQLIFLAINRGISMIQRLILKIIITVGNTEPRWVVLQYTTPETFTLGLLTQSGTKQATIYLPTGPRLIPGQLVFVNNNKWRPLNISFEEGLKMFISLGLMSDTQKTAQEIWLRMEEF